jgi:hypothetical protein
VIEGLVRALRILRALRSLDVRVKNRVSRVEG